MIKLIVDCTCEMSTAEAEKLGIIAMPMHIMIDGQEYLAGKNLDNDTFYNMLPNLKDTPKTMQINAQEYIDAIKPLLDAGDEVFVMSISSGLSGTFNSLTQAAKELNSPKLVIFDTQTFTLGYYALVMEAYKMINHGVTLEELNRNMEELRERVRIYFIADTVKYLVKGGRISFVKGFVANTLHVKPVIGVVDGKLRMVTQGIGYNMTKRKVLNFTKNADITMPFYYGHIYASEKAEDFKQIFNFDFVEKREIGPIVGAHGGPGAVGLAFFEQPKVETPETEAADKEKKPTLMENMQNLYKKILHKKD